MALSKSTTRGTHILPLHFEDKPMTEPTKEQTILNVENGLSKELPILPLKNMVLLPRSIVPLVVGRSRSIHAIEAALKTDREICVVAQKDQTLDNPGPHDIYLCGTRATILQVMPIAKGNLKILVEGINRIAVTPDEVIDSYLKGVCTDLVSTSDDSIGVQALWRQLKISYKQYAQISNQVPAHVLATVQNLEDISGAADTIIVHSSIGFKERQTLLELVDLEKRLALLTSILQREIEIIKTEERIRDRVHNQVEKNQREYYLSEQLKAINKELGRDEQLEDVMQLRAQALAAKLPVVVMQKVERELKRLEQMPSLSAEAAVSKNYIDWLVSIPWHAVSKDRVSIEHATKILDKDHYGLKKVKDRILEFISAKKFNPNLSKSPIICLVGPPGVGKTSLARSIATSLGREFTRISLGGVRDESEIRGHRRTYIGALPGKIIQAMGNVKTVNPVILLDEIDKMSSDLYGDPSSALLEVLDPEQNVSFVDNFIEVGYDLSRVMFITTANSIDGIPYPLFDRMEVIGLSGYTDTEKLNIAQKFLLPKLFKEYGIAKQQCKISTEVVNFVISEYTREAGVRQLERTLGKLVRKAIQEILKSNAVKKETGDAPHKKMVVSVSIEQCRTWLGLPPFKKRPLTDNTSTGRATGLAWTELGGDVLEIETAILPGKGELTLTGQLGDVMRESAQAALSFVKANSTHLKLKKNFFSTHDIHVHVPEGATPKDGPSAGITMCTALVSAVTNTPIRSDVAMTGEITLRGRVLAIGGLKEKLIAAHQHNISNVVVPEENREEIASIREEIPKSINVQFVQTIDQVFQHAFHKNPFVA